jgi:hypothetical protein
MLWVYREKSPETIAGMDTKQVGRAGASPAARMKKADVRCAEGHPGRAKSRLNSHILCLESELYFARSHLSALGF